MRIVFFVTLAYSIINPGEFLNLAPFSAQFHRIRIPHLLWSSRQQYYHNYHTLPCCILLYNHLLRHMTHKLRLISADLQEPG
jgi:hypothetical protein